MKNTFILMRILSFLLIIAVLLSCSSCYRETYISTNIVDYSKIFTLGEFRDNFGMYLVFPSSTMSEAKETFDWYCEAYGFDNSYKSLIEPPQIEELNITSFYISWELSFVGSASVELLLSVQYQDEEKFQNEICRLSQIKVNQQTVYDEETFSMPAYVFSLGHFQTNQYVLVDSKNMCLHYIHLQLCYKDDMKKIPADYLPKKYYDLGEVEGQDFSIYESLG